MSRKVIPQFDAISGNDITADDLIAVWDESELTTKQITVRELMFVGEQFRRKPTLSDFTGSSWYSQDGSSLTEVPRGILFDNHSGTGGELLSVYAKPMPATPFTVEFGFIAKNTPNYSGFGLVLAQDGLTNLAFAQAFVTGRIKYLNLRYMSNSSSYVSDGVMDQAFAFSYTEIFMKYVDDGTNIYLYHSPDLENWFQIYTVAKTAPFGGWSPTIMGIGLWKLSSMYVQGILTHWKEY